MIPAMKIVPVRAFRDNYIWLLTNGQQAVAVDPGDAAPVLDTLHRCNLHLSAILITHRHSDHIDGVPDLVRQFRSKVFAPACPDFDFSYQPVSAGLKVDLPELGVTAEVFETPGHTREHVAYYVGNSLFCGDTLFGCGCGRVFDGAPEQLFDSLQKLASFPDDTLVYPAHEYTLSNIRFARYVDPGNADVVEREKSDREKIDRVGSTLPTTLSTEKLTNPFLRCHTPSVIHSARQIDPNCKTDPAAVFKAIRELKNNF